MARKEDVSNLTISYFSFSMVTRDPQQTSFPICQLV